MARHRLHRILSAAYIIAGLAMGVATGASAHSASTQPAATDCAKVALNCALQNTPILAETLAQFSTPSFQPPKPPKPVVTVRYSVETRGAMTADLATFKQLANETLNDGRGWSQMGVVFTEVPTGGDFTLVLAEASAVAQFSSGCDALYSCNVGRYVIINQDRWQGATPSWNNAGGSLRDYRHMVVNHETGHWLGHGHATCPGAGQPAAVMQQQSIDLQGCTFNPWPLPSELNSSRLGL